MRFNFFILFLATSSVSGRHSSHSRHSHSSHSTHSSHSSHGSYGSHGAYHPASTGYSGHGSGGAHTYPASSGLSGNTYSGNHVGQSQHQQHSGVHSIYSPKTEVHHHYHYRPPLQIRYGSTFHQPVYQGHLPVYVYEYRNSGSRFDNLLTGLALYNLGRNSHYHHHSSERQYSSTSGEICKLGISKRSGEYEETRIDCNLMSSFIWANTTNATQDSQHVVMNTTVVTVTQTVNGTGNFSVTTTTGTNTTVEDALKVKGPSIAVTPDMTCYLIRTLRSVTVLQKPVECGLLQEYARSSFHRNAAQCLMAFKTIVLKFPIILWLLRY